ncbi:MAG TPA: hypothetical protein VF750_00765 [Sphingomicrobium sp.]
MRYYRLYFMNRSSGHIDQFREFEAADDQAAIAAAENWLDGQPMELWNQDRKLKHWTMPSPDRD